MSPAKNEPKNVAEIGELLAKRLKRLEEHGLVNVVGNVANEDGLLGLGVRDGNLMSAQGLIETLGL